MLNCKFLYSEEVKIQFKINNEIITNVDIKNETKYLIFLNPGLKKLDETKLNTIAENVFLMKEGEFIWNGTKEEMKSSKNREIAEFLRMD